jgi:hypothetical protein
MNAFFYSTNGQHLPEVTKPNKPRRFGPERLVFATFHHDRIAAVLYLGTHTEEQSLRGSDSTGECVQTVSNSSAGSWASFTYRF